MVECSSTTTDMTYSQSVKFVTNILNEQSNKSDVIVVRYGNSSQVLVNTAKENMTLERAVEILKISHRVDLGSSNITSALDFVLGSLKTSSQFASTASGSGNVSSSESSLSLNGNNSRSLLFQISSSISIVEEDSAKSLSLMISDLGLESFVVSGNVNNAAGLEVLASQPSSGHVFICDGDLSDVGNVVTTLQPYLQSGKCQNCLLK